MPRLFSDERTLKLNLTMNSGKLSFSVPATTSTILIAKVSVTASEPPFEPTTRFTPESPVEVL